MKRRKKKNLIVLFVENDYEFDKVNSEVLLF